MGRMSEETPKAEDAKVEEAVQEVAVEETVPAAEKAAPVKEVTPTSPRELAQPSADFDWESIDNSDDSMPDEERAKLEELYAANLTLIEDK